MSARRKAVKKLVVCAGALAGYSMLPDKWIKPVVEQFILPAHAQTSGLTLVNPLTLTFSLPNSYIFLRNQVLPKRAAVSFGIHTLNNGSCCCAAGTDDPVLPSPGVFLHHQFNGSRFNMIRCVKNRL